MDYLDDKHYCSAYNVLTTGDLFGVKMCYDDIPNRLNPYDYEAFNAYKGKAYAVVTNIETGQPEYLRLKEMNRDIIACLLYTSFCGCLRYSGLRPAAESGG